MGKLMISMVQCLNCNIYDQRLDSYGTSSHEDPMNVPMTFLSALSWSKRPEPVGRVWTAASSCGALTANQQAEDLGAMENPWKIDIYIYIHKYIYIYKLKIKDK